MWVLASALRRNRSGCAFKNLQKCLLHTFTGNVASDRGVLGFTSDLVDFIDVDDAGFGFLHVVIGGLDQLEQDVLDVLTHITGLGESRGIGNSERNVQHASQCLGKKRLAATGGTNKQDVGFRQFNVVALGNAVLNAAVVVVHRYRENALGLLLPDDVVVQEFKNLDRLGKLFK
ncbi:unannotated protein [freshwater metagenome]|uniref:Unannotated protein n=1 Tax=freshwater metagenome TaxID=449393 RepID=A0A6J6ASB2_9ZZZZ